MKVDPAILLYRCMESGVTVSSAAITGISWFHGFCITFLQITYVQSNVQIKVHHTFSAIICYKIEKKKLVIIVIEVIDGEKNCCSVI